MKGKKNMNGLYCEIYKSKYGCDLNIASSGDEVLLLGDGPFDAETTDKPVVKLVRLQIGGREYLHVEPVAPVPDGYIGYMAGGNFIYTSDSRFPSDYPLSLHDRIETREMNEALSI